MRRNLLVVALGIAFLILITWAGSVITAIVPHRVTAQVQTSHAGPYQITLQVHPNPPLITQPATLGVQVLLASSQQPVTNARVTLASDMESMDMGITSAAARPVSDGSYRASVQFDMSGTWQVVVQVAIPGAAPASASFEVTAQ
jgi:YtkA-like